MTIGEALHTVRNELYLTQEQMCAGVVSRSFYAKVESGKNSISADKLAKILFEHEIDIPYFYQLLQKTYTSKQKAHEILLNQNMEQAFNSGDITQIEKCYHQILAHSQSRILKLRAMIAVANIKDELDLIDPQIKHELFVEFDEGKNWMTRPELLRLFTNTMPLWDQESLDFFIGRLLSKAKKDPHISELQQQRYLRIFENYLAVCYKRSTQNKSIVVARVKQIIDYIMTVSPNPQLLIYKVAAVYLKELLSGNKEETQKIKNELEKYGYHNIVKTWPQ
ncbi:helix-turn-helix domain-containing protein [uncultured Lactobacillus sp.]|uniref:helix-turn-helix domain-containing protein n=1 Tax=uncultured Lactobacillus sp. TaxID=153152 RepID=UPI002604177F|nr:helix-turn-helix transcriptional regulator [uncultured Lactobacillus sp.]